MKQIIILLCGLGFATAVTAQTVTLTGKIWFGDESPAPKVFYAVQGQPFKAAQTVVFDNELNYKLALTPAILKSNPRGKLFFTTDLTDKADSNSFLFAIRLAQLFADMKAAGKTTWEVPTDLMVGSITSEGPPEMREKDRPFVGKYTLVCGDSTYNIQLSEEYQSYEAQLVLPGGEMLPTESGYWHYYEYGNELELVTERLRNETYNLQKSIRISRSFSVESPSKLVFKGREKKAYSDSSISTLRMTLTKVPAE